MAEANLNSPHLDEKRVEKPPTTASSQSATNHSSIDADPEKPPPDDSDLSRPESNLEKGLAAIVPIEEKASTAVDSGISDPDLVDWNSPDDPAKALNWPSKKKWGNIAVISSITFLTPLASSMFAPGIPELMREFHSHNQTIASFVVSIYVLGYAIGPLIIAPLSELYGRLIIYHSCNVIFIIFTIACAVAPNVGSLLFFRLIEGCAGSAPLTIGGGSIADMIVQEKRGGALAIFALGPLLGPVIGPVAGGYLSQAKGWRWVFWVITMAAGALAISSFIFMRETYEPTLLARRADRLRKETNNPALRSKFDLNNQKPRDVFLKAIVRPTKMLLLSPIVFSLSLYMAVVYGYLYLLFTTLTSVFESKYNFTPGNVGLTFLGIGVGSLLGLVGFGLASDLLVKRMSKNGEMKPEYRLPPLIPGSLLIPLGLFWYGWTAEKGAHFIIPILGTMFIGLGLMATFMPITTYLVDAYTIHAASAMAASTVLRSLAGAFLPLAGPKMYAALGLGWGNSLLAFVALAMCPMTWVFFRYGERIRKSRRFELDL
jgi:multidrug resistance protein